MSAKFERLVADLMEGADLSREQVLAGLKRATEMPVDEDCARGDHGWVVIKSAPHASSVLMKCDRCIATVYVQPRTGVTQ